jgi:hypothetical protein
MPNAAFDPADRPRRFDLKMDEDGQWRDWHTLDVSTSDAISAVNRLTSEIMPSGMTAADQSGYDAAIAQIKSDLASVQAQIAVIDALV